MKLFGPLLLLLVTAAATPATAASPGDRPVFEPVGGCSRAKAALARTATLHRTGAARTASAAGTDVLHERLELVVDPMARSVAGTTTLTFRSLEDGLAAFTVRLHPNLAVQSVTVDGEAAVWERDEGEDAVRIALDPPRSAGEVATVAVGYSGIPPSAQFGETGIYFEWRDGSPLVYTLSEPWLAETWWAVKEDNTDKATAELEITVPAELTVVANGVLQEVRDTGDGRRTFHWATAYPIAPYLVAFAAAPYHTFEDTFPFEGGATPVRFFILPESDTTFNRQAWLRSLDMLRTFGSLYGLYPFASEKYAIYEFGFPGGMEHQTATGQAGFSEGLTAHELAHQWWGDMVTCASWHDIWLNEGFATYSEALWWEYGGDTDDRETLRAVMQAYRPDDLAETVYVYDDSDIERIFSSNSSYRKGAWVLHMLRGVVGDEAFFGILREYRRRFAYRSATTEDFRTAAESVWGADLGWFFDQWVYGSGGPIYRWGRRELQLGGSRFLEVSVRQTQGGTPFTMPLQVRTVDGGAPHTATVWNRTATAHYLLPLAGPLDGVELDPDGWVLSRGNAEEPFVPGPPKLAASQPPPGTPLPSSGAVISLTFQEDVTISGDDVRLERMPDGAAVPLSVQYDSGAVTARLTAEGPLAPGLYRLTVRDSVTDTTSGLALDGETGGGPGRLPSGDGAPGGDATLLFPVNGARSVQLSSAPAAGGTGAAAGGSGP